MRRCLTVLMIAAVALIAGCSDASIEAVETVETAEPIADVVPSGREALAAVQGKPHVLWFWGAH